MYYQTRVHMRNSQMDGRTRHIVENLGINCRVPRTPTITWRYAILDMVKSIYETKMQIYRTVFFFDTAKHSSMNFNKIFEISSVCVGHLYKNLSFG